MVHRCHRLEFTNDDDTAELFDVLVNVLIGEVDIAQWPITILYYRLHISVDQQVGGDQSVVDDQIAVVNLNVVDETAIRQAGHHHAGVQQRAESV